MACQFIPIGCQIILIWAYLKDCKHSIAFGLSSVVSVIIGDGKGKWHVGKAQNFLKIFPLQSHETSSQNKHIFRIFDLINDKSIIKAYRLYMSVD